MHEHTPGQPCISDVQNGHQLTAAIAIRIGHENIHDVRIPGEFPIGFQARLPASYEQAEEFLPGGIRDAQKK